MFDLPAMRNITRNLKFTESIHLKLLYYYFRVCGVAPIDVDIQAINSAKVNSWTFKRSWKDTLYSLFLIALIITWSYANMNDNYYKQKHLGFDNSVYAIVDTYAIFNTLCIVLIFCVQQRKQLVIFSRVNSIREIINRNNNSTSEHNTLLYKIMILLVIKVLSWVFLITTIAMYEYEDAISLTAPAFWTFIRNALTLQYCINIILIGDLLKTLNENLSDLSKYFSLTPEVTSINAIEINNKFSQLWEWYSLISKLSEDIAHFYSLPMLLNIFGDLLMTITITYYASKPLIFGNSDLDTLDYVNSVGFLLIHVYPIILLTTSASDTIDKGQKTSELVNDYLKEPETQIIKDKLLHFSIYLLHHDIEFTVFDLFSLDGSLLVSITGSVTTYLVILLQFQPPALVTSITKYDLKSSTFLPPQKNNLL